SILNDMSRLVSSAPANASEIYGKTLQLALRLPGLSVGSVLRYDESREKFMVVLRLGLSRRFEERAQLSLSEPLVDELFTLRRPVIIADVRERYRSALMAAAAQESL